MFAATLLFCLHTAAATPQCGRLTDRNGPQETEAACQARIVEMQTHLDAMRPDEIVAVGRLLLPKFVEYETGVSQPVRGGRFPSEHTGISGTPLTIACAYVL